MLYATVLSDRLLQDEPERAVPAPQPRPRGAGAGLAGGRAGRGGQLAVLLLPAWQPPLRLHWRHSHNNKSMNIFWTIFVIFIPLFTNNFTLVVLLVEFKCNDVVSDSN